MKEPFEVISIEMELLNAEGKPDPNFKMSKLYKT